MSWIAAGVAAAGTAASVGGGILSRNEATKNAEREAAARNASLAKNIEKLGAFGAQNRGVFDTNMLNYAPTTQAAGLDRVQTMRGDANAANITQPNPGATPIQADASPATRSDLAKRMLAVYNSATARAHSMGRLGGYSDQWVNNQLGDQQAGRDIGVTNNMAAGRKALIQPEADLAGAGAYKAPSIWPTLLSGAGKIASAAGGAGLGAGGFGAAQAPLTANQIATLNLTPDDI